MKNIIGGSNSQPAANHLLPVFPFKQNHSERDNGQKKSEDEQQKHNDRIEKEKTKSKRDGSSR